MMISTRRFRRRPASASLEIRGAYSSIAGGSETGRVQMVLFHQITHQTRSPMDGEFPVGRKMGCVDGAIVGVAFHRHLVRDFSQDIGQTVQQGFGLWADLGLSRGEKEEFRQVDDQPTGR
jgi:hypothetical protein